MKKKLINFLIQFLGLIVFIICFEIFEKISINRHKKFQASEDYKHEMESQ